MMRRYILTLTDIILNLVEFLLMTRIVLKLFGARTVAPFVAWVYETTNPLLAPFEGMFPTSSLGDGFTLEISALFAVLFYGFLGFLLQLTITSLSQFGQSHQPSSEETVRHATPTKKRR